MERASWSRQAMAFGLATLVLAGGARAEVTAEEAKALGTTLTGFGAERAASADGRIPEYTGGLTGVPAGYKPGDGKRIDPFADEKPVMSLTSANVVKAASELTAGTQELLRRYPEFRIDVYPTHRTQAYPDWLIANTRRNATEAHTMDHGEKVASVLPGIPFPIPRNGAEVMWNHRLHYMGRALSFKYDSWLVDGAGQATLASTAQSTWEFPIFLGKHDSPIEGTDSLLQWRLEYTAPQRRAGEAMLLIDAVDPQAQARRAWYYFPGQRRVKTVELPDDTLHSSSSGTYTNDDAFVYTGVLERFDLKLLGKREMLLPYNTYRLTYHDRGEDIVQPKYVNPDMLRWELHRVWVVEATLKPGAHHIYSRRVFYVDEDSWTALASDEYGMDGKLVRAVYALPTFSYGSDAAFTVSHVAYNLENGAYYLAFLPGPHGGVRYVDPLPASQWLPDSIAGAGVR